MSDFPVPGSGPSWGAPPPPAPPPAPPGYGAPPPHAPGATPYPSSGYGPPAGYAPQAPGNTAIVPVRSLASALSILLAVAAVGAAFAALAYVHRATVADDFIDRATVSLSDLRDADRQVGIAVGLCGLLFVSILVVLIVWQHRYARNAQVLTGPLGLGPGWAIGGWFIPIGWFVLPGLQLAQSAKASDPAVQLSRDRRSGSVPGILVVWAILLDVAAIVFISSSGQRPSTSDVGFAFDANQRLRDFASADRTAAVAMVFVVVAAIAAVGMVRTLTQRQEQAVAARRAAPSPGYPPPPGYASPYPGYAAPSTTPGWGPPPAPMPPPANAPPPATPPGPPLPPPPPWTNEPGASS